MYFFEISESLQEEQIWFDLMTTYFFFNSCPTFSINFKIINYSDINSFFIAGWTSLLLIRAL